MVADTLLNSEDLYKEATANYDSDYESEPEAEPDSDSELEAERCFFFFSGTLNF